jgi:hypothetical protein
MTERLSLRLRNLIEQMKESDRRMQELTEKYISLASEHLDQMKAIIDD